MDESRANHCATPLASDEPVATTSAERALIILSDAAHLLALHEKPNKALTDDKLEGATAIAEFLGWKPRRVYALRKNGSDCPIRLRQGVGIYAFKSELTEWLRAPETLPSHRPAKVETKPASTDRRPDTARLAAAQAAALNAIRSIKRAKPQIIDALR